MQENTHNIKSNMNNWFTINEAKQIARRESNQELSDSCIYRYALCGDISISIYFQSPVILRKIRRTEHKIKLTQLPYSSVNRICFLEKNCFLNDRNLILSTEGKYIHPTHRVIDTDLYGYEYVLIQRLLAHSLNIPQPITGANEINYGITVSLSGNTYQILEKMTFEERIKKQMLYFPETLAHSINEFITTQKTSRLNRKGYFPIHDLPADACFVIRHSELKKLTALYSGKEVTSSIPTRVSTPLSRLFWLACKHNETISPLIRQPYKLLSIFEQWASDEGITDHLSGDTLKNALKRGSPSSTSLNG
ncbi:TPA: hypothetical protein QHR21_004535 [Klebsiella pneumoniae]|nr:hypothetical protein [Klebsiella pneumoniae]